MNKSDLGIMLLCSLRYAYGRKSYITGMVADLLIKYKDSLDTVDKALIMNALNNSLSNDDPGMSMDKENWERAAKVYNKCDGQ